MLSVAEAVDSWRVRGGGLWMKKSARQEGGGGKVSWVSVDYLHEAGSPKSLMTYSGWGGLGVGAAGIS